MAGEVVTWSRVREAMESDGITLHCFHVFSRADAG
jgi:hypothetical protein